MTILTLPVQCFGAFRKFGDNLSVQVNAGPTVLDIKQAIVRQLGEEHYEDGISDWLPVHSLNNETAQPMMCSGRC